MTGSDWITLSLGAVGLVFTTHQILLSRHTFRLELFEKRYKVYDATMTFSRGVAGGGTFEDALFFDFSRNTSDAVFLFGDDVVDYLALLRTRSLAIRSLDTQFHSLPLSDVRTSLVEQHSEGLSWLGDQLIDSKTVFLPYLAFNRTVGAKFFP